MTMAALKEITDVLETYSGDQYVFHTGIDEKGNSFWEVEFFFNSEADKYNYLDGNNRPLDRKTVVPREEKWMIGKTSLKDNQHVLKFLQKGDIIRIPRMIYDHFAIYIGDGYVVHFGKDENGNICVKEDDFFKVCKNSKAEKYNYLDGEKKPLDSKKIVARAKLMIGKSGYNLLTNNCEHLATFCRYGIQFSQQVDTGILHSLQVVVWAIAMTVIFIIAPYLLGTCNKGDVSFIHDTAWHRYWHWAKTGKGKVLQIVVLAITTIVIYLIAPSFPGMCEKEEDRLVIGGTDWHLLHFASSRIGLSTHSTISSWNVSSWNVSSWNVSLWNM